MKAQSLENQLRNAVPPAPEMEARLRARRAALAEFARVHGTEGEAVTASEAARAAHPSPAAHSSHSSRQAGGAGPDGGRPPAEASRDSTQPRPKRELLWPAGWPLRNAWLGGVATACVVVIGVSVVYLMPAKDREIQLSGTLTTANGPAASGLVPSDASKADAPDSGPPRVIAQPAEATGRAESEAAARAESKVVPAEPAEIEPAPAASDHRRTNASARAALRRIAGTAGIASPAGTAGTAATPVTGPAALPAASTSRSDENRGLTASQTAGPTVAPQKNVNETEEVTVTGARIQPSEAYSSVNPVVTMSDNSTLEEAVVVGPRVQKRSLFASRASAPVAPPPPVAPADDGRDKFQHFETNPVKRVAADPVSTFSVDVDTAAYSFVRRKLNEGVMPQPDSVRVEEMINYFDYAWPTSDSRDQPFKPTITVSDSPWGAGKKLIHIGIKGYALPASQQPDVNLVLLLDVSGSMDSPDKLPLAKRSMAMLLDSLRPTDTVAIVVYAGQAGQVLAPTPIREKETILHALDSLQPGGSTAGAAGIRLAYELAEKSFRKGGVNRILLATDGDFNVGITDQNELKGFVAREREKGVYLSVLGFGEGNYRDEMAQTLAQNGNGVAAYIDTLNEAKKVLVQEATSSLFPIAKDVKLQVEFNPATVAEYRLVGYETRALNREDFNNDKVDAGDVGSGHTVTAIYEITPVGSNAKLIDDARYSQRELRPASARGKANEYGYLKIRYKLPNGSVSRLLEQPIRVDAGVPAALRDDVAFSTAVAGFGQLLRGSQYVGSLSYEDVIKQAQGGIGEDRFGYRAELVQLLSKAQRAR